MVMPAPLPLCAKYFTVTLPGGLQGCSGTKVPRTGTLTAKGWAGVFNGTVGVVTGISLHERAFWGHDGLHEYPEHARYRAVVAHDARNADEVVSRANKRAKIRLCAPLAANWVAVRQQTLRSSAGNP
jgi:hypothetical protein